MKMRSKIFILVTTMLLCLAPTCMGADSQPQAVFVIGNGTYNVNGYVKQDVAPYINNNRTYLPFRYAAYAIGIGDNSIQWDQDSQTAFLWKDGQLMSVKIGSNTITLGDKTVNVDSPAEIKDGRTMLPLRAVSELFGCKVEWDGVNKRASISL